MPPPTAQSLRMNPRRKMPSKPAVFALLMLLALILALLPAGWTNWIRSPFQVLVFLQRPVTTAGQGVDEELDTVLGGQLSRKQAQQLVKKHDRMRLKVAQLEAWLQVLEQRFDAVCGVREQLWSDAADIVIAPVYGYDSSPRRDTLLIGRGSEARLRPGQWVVAGIPPEEIDRSERGAELMLAQWLVGRVSEVFPRVSRVRLASDPRFGAPHSGEKVMVAKELAKGYWDEGRAVFEETTEAVYLLTGLGRGRMLIGQADADLYGAGYRFVLVPSSPDLPATLSIGKVVGSKRLEQAALHFDVMVAPWQDPAELAYVFVIATPG
jgi:cell shape-determining protein MreC